MDALLVINTEESGLGQKRENNSLERRHLRRLSGRGDGLEVFKGQREVHHMRGLGGLFIESS